MNWSKFLFYTFLFRKIWSIDIFKIALDQTGQMEETLATKLEHSHLRKLQVKREAKLKNRGSYIKRTDKISDEHRTQDTHTWALSLHQPLNSLPTTQFLLYKYVPVLFSKNKKKVNLTPAFGLFIDSRNNVNPKELAPVWARPPFDPSDLVLSIFLRQQIHKQCLWYKLCSQVQKGARPFALL